MSIPLSPVIAGTMNWGAWQANFNPAQMAQLINNCISVGITTFDHADIYGGYTTEADFGLGFAQSGVKREDIQLISKCGIQHTVGNRPIKVKHYNYSKDYIIWSAENSLKFLKTDYLDVLLLHRPSPLMQPGEIAEAIHKLKGQGKIREFGLSNFTTSQTELIKSLLHVYCNQIEFSATAYQPMLDGSLDFMQLHNIKPMAWSPVGSVFKAENAQTDRLKTLLLEFVEKYEATADVILLAWIMQHPAGIVPVSGSCNFDRLKNQVKAASLTLDLEDWFAIWTESMGHKVP
ncbi:aldo/keto reductase [Flavobacterium subsaxonicum]|uniref:Aldo/keto reductase n=1 Tax=Flavobacterium subsaxonicum WB 4.1-42 = DSM 21790 TaxID=1121898 RepID=A0A0A2MHM0_9FLAO|nr:aldo/keto reductase [Flavobacterium subsaxonicum]KGO91779.1 aldo/keto reductase [Flavobacterium subsaxonicum WB 4.1-42 = DSM 21790]